MTSDMWASILKAAVRAGGGALQNGWTVQVKPRSTGGRTIKITDDKGHIFRSICQATSALEGDRLEPKKGLKAASKGGARVLQDGKKEKGKLANGFTSKGQGTKKQKRKVSEESIENKEVKRRKIKGVELAEEDDTATAPSEYKEHPVFAKLLRQARIHVSRIRREMDILEVYDAEGWRGSNKDKLKPRAEMERARTQMAASKEAVRNIVRQCEAGEGAAIPAEDYDTDGGLDSSAIFCAICRTNQSTDENDIVLCDGPCNRAFHEKCCTPNFVAAELDEEDDWLCPACFTKDEVLDLLNEEFETSYEIDTPAAELMREGSVEQHQNAESQAGAVGGTWASLLGGADLVSSDTDDESYRGNTQDEGDEIGPDCEGAHASRSPSKPSSSSSDDESNSSEELVMEGKRKRAKIDYVAMNSQMFGDEEEDDSDQDYRKAGKKRRREKEDERS